MDTVSPEVRSKTMRAVRSRNNKSTERKLRASLSGAGISGWKLNVPDLPGKPDFVFESHRLIVFVDGCFWHGCPDCYRRPSSSQEYWDAKVKRNSERDKKNTAVLESSGWRVLRIWEHELSDLKSVREALVTMLGDRLSVESRLQ